MWGSHRILQALFVVLLTVFFAENSWGVGARMQKPCANCHIMHDSTGGGPVAKGAGDPQPLVGPQEALMNFTCSGCHSGTNSAASRAPFVVDFGTLPDYGLTGTTGNTLAGGNFYWVANADGGLQGHDVAGLNITQTVRKPPGGSKQFNNTDTPLTCAGTNGCHGDDTVDGQVQAIWGGHHGNTTGEAIADNTPPSLLTPTSYRFLNGIVGKEDDEWERIVDKDTHNQYKGVARSDDVDTDTTTISYLCARCHGDFHFGGGALGVAEGGNFATPWLRHPVDIDMGPLAGAGTEYASYGDAGVDGDYNVRTPLASEAVGTTLSSVTLGSANKNAIITCITCHRAHGSKYDYSLRWDYKNWPGAGYNGCGDCHTAKT